MKNNNLNEKYISKYGSDKNKISEIDNYLKDSLYSDYFKGESNQNIYYECYEKKDAKASIVISHGFAESLAKYRELIYYFLQNGLNVYGIEHCGHGRSGSLSKIHYSQVNVENFDYYINDLKKFMDTIVMPRCIKPVYLFAHSMGGGIGSLFLERHPGYFNKAILNAPMMEIDTGKTPTGIAKILSKLYVSIGKGDNFVFGHGPFSPEPNLQVSGTSCENRYNNYHGMIITTKDFQRSGASFRWLNEAFKATDELTKEKNASKVTIPVLLFQAENDTFVKSGGQNKFAKYAKNCTLRMIKKSKHEIYFERDEILHPYLDEALEFLLNNK